MMAGGYDSIGRMANKPESMPVIRRYNNNIVAANPIEYLTKTQINVLTKAFQDYHDSNDKKVQKINRGQIPAHIFGSSLYRSKDRGGSLNR